MGCHFLLQCLIVEPEAILRFYCIDLFVSPSGVCYFKSFTIFCLAGKFQSELKLEIYAFPTIFLNLSTLAEIKMHTLIRT